MTYLVIVLLHEYSLEELFLIRTACKCKTHLVLILLFTFEITRESKALAIFGFNYIGHILFAIIIHTENRRCRICLYIRNDWAGN